MSSAMKVSQWTSSYADQFRDQNAYISPNAGQSMYHFNGHYDPSHYQRDPGFYGTRAKLAATAKADTQALGLQVRVPLPGQGAVGYGEAPTKSRQTHLNHSFYAPPPDPNTQYYSALRQTGINALQTQRIGSAGGNGNGEAGLSASQPAGSFSARATYGDKNLWNHPIVAHSDRSSYSDAKTVFPVNNGSASARFAGASGSASQRFSSSSSSSSTYSTGGLIDTAFVDAPADWRYSRRGVAETKLVDLHRNTDPRNKFHIPGYQGYVRGKLFVHGDTFGKTTRNCLDIPLDYPTETE